MPTLLVVSASGFCRMRSIPGTDAVKVGYRCDGHPVFSPKRQGARMFLSHTGRRDRALIGLMVYSFARIGAAPPPAAWQSIMSTHRTPSCASDYGRRAASAITMPYHDNLERYLTAYLVKQRRELDISGLKRPRSRSPALGIALSCAG